MKRPKNITKQDWILLENKYINLEPIVEKINNGYPVQYLIGNVDFYGYKILVNPRVLIPRFETETLVEKTIKHIKDLKLNKASLLEIGTGSGCISIALKKEIKSLEITAMDKSRKALKVAKKNGKLNKVNINFIKKDLFNYNLINKYDVIVSNPPYITKGDKVSINTKYEPEMAIYVNNDPLEFYKKIFEIGLTSLNPKSLIALEIDENEGPNLKKLAKEYYPKAKILLNKDLAGKDRYLFIINE